jgi:hypothetical protein
VSLVRRGETSKLVLQEITGTHSAGSLASTCHFDAHWHSLVITNRMAWRYARTAAVWDAHIKQGYSAAKAQMSLIGFFS